MGEKRWAEKVRAERGWRGRHMLCADCQEVKPIPSRDRLEQIDPNNRCADCRGWA